MDNNNDSIQEQIIRKIDNPILLFAISFAIILLSIGLYDTETVASLVVPLLIIFLVGMIGAVILQIFRVKNSNREKNTYALIPRGVVQILPNRTSTAKILASVSSETKSIRVLAISSMTSTLPTGIRDKFATLRNTEIKWLFLNPNSRYVAARVRENPIRTEDDLRHHILSGIGLVYKAKVDNKLKKFHIRCYDEPAVFRVVIIDEKAYFSYYPCKGSGDKVPVLIITKGQNWLLDAIDKYFESLWDRSEPYKRTSHNV